MTNKEKLEKIKSYFGYINKHANEELKWFSSINEEEIFLDGKKLSQHDVPEKFRKFLDRDEFWVHVDVKDKTVIYYAYDIKSYITDEKINEENGTVELDLFAESILNFLLRSLKEITTTQEPYIDISNLSKTTEPKEYSSYPYHDERNIYPKKDTTTYSYTPPKTYSFNGYRDREDFYDKITECIKKHKTSHAIKIINEKLSSMLVDKEKLDDLNTLIKQLKFDKLNVPIMLAILNSTQGQDEILKDRKEFSEKVQKYLSNMKRPQAKNILEEIECIL